MSLDINKIYCQDCMIGMKSLDDSSIDMVLCDLPYAITASKWDKLLPLDKLWEQYKRVIKPTGSIVLFASGQFVPKLMSSNLADYKYSWIWVKKNSTNFVHAKNRPMSKYEQILVFSSAPMGHKSLLGNKRMIYNPQGLIPYNKIQKQGAYRFGNLAGKRPSQLKTGDTFIREFTNYPCDILTDYPDLPCNKKHHPNEKPVLLLEYLVKTYTNVGGLVLDNCIGSGSTAIACMNTGRNFIGFETEPKYCDISNARISENKGVDDNRG
jgi:site-specific DNA-methyltransferase (adenine-specific)